MSKCFYCFQPKQEPFVWSHFLKNTQSDLLCDDCIKQIDWIGATRCPKCGRDSEVEQLCLDCLNWEASMEWSGVLENNISFIKYNAFMKEFFARYKYRGDYELAKVLAELLKSQMNTIREIDFVCPIPLSEERLVERGFNQVGAVLDFLELPYENLLVRNHSEKQAKKSKKERIQLGDIFSATMNVEEQTILLVDDIYTTGSTIYHAAKVLKKAGAHKVFSMTFVRA